MPFPNTSILDDFNRSSENLDHGNWSLPSVTSFYLVIDTATNARGTNGTTGLSNSYWNPTNYAWTSINQVEMFIDMKTIDGSRRFMLDFYDDPNSASPNGYELQANFSGTTVRLRKVTAGVGANLTTVAQTVSANDGIGWSCLNGSHTVWYRSGSGGTWTSIATASDSAYTTGYFQLGVEGSTAMLGNFGGGVYVTSAGPSAPVLATPLRSALRW